jgi:hypothetical protein
MKKSNDFDLMNPEEFEQQLSRRPLRPVPPEWRAEILREARAAAPSSSRETFAVTLWRELFWSCRRVWTGLAAVWLAVVVINTAIDDSPRVTVASAPHQSQDWKLALQAQREMVRQLLKQDAPPVAVVPHRRSDRRNTPIIG